MFYLVETNQTVGTFHIIIWKTLCVRHLTSLIKEVRYIPAQLLACLTTQVLDVLTFLNEHGIVHRNMRPPNILLTGRGIAKNR